MAIGEGSSFRGRGSGQLILAPGRKSAGGGSALMRDISTVKVLALHEPALSRVSLR